MLQAKNQNDRVIHAKLLQSYWLKAIYTSNEDDNSFSFLDRVRIKKFERSEENTPPHAKLFFGRGGGGFVKRFSEFAKGIYEKCDRHFFNLAIIIVVAVFSVVQLIFYFYVC